MATKDMTLTPNEDVIKASKAVGIKLRKSIDKAVSSGRGTPKGAKTSRKSAFSGKRARAEKYAELRRKRSGPQRVQVKDLELTEELAEAFYAVASSLAQGHTVVVGTADDDLTTTQAAAASNTALMPLRCNGAGIACCGSGSATGDTCTSAAGSMIATNGGASGSAVIGTSPMRCMGNQATSASRRSGSESGSALRPRLRGEVSLCSSSYTSISARSGATSGSQRFRSASSSGRRCSSRAVSHSLPAGSSRTTPGRPSHAVHEPTDAAPRARPFPVAPSPVVRCRRPPPPAPRSKSGT